MSLDALRPGAVPTKLPTGGAQNLLQGKGPAAVQVYQIDDFVTTDQSGATTHGAQVEHELGRTFVSQGGLKSRRVQLPLHFDVKAIEEGKPGALDGYFAQHFTDRLKADVKAWSEVLEGDRRAVVHQSQGASDSRAVEHLYFRARKDPEFRAQLEVQLGLPLTGSGKFDDGPQSRLLAALTALSSSIHQSDPSISEKVGELRELQSKAAAKGHVHVISAGNSGSLYREMQKHMVPTPVGFFVNEMASPFSIIVGASDDGSQEPTSANPHTVAKLASPFAGAMFGADGVDRPITLNGTTRLDRGSSYASPQVSAKIINLLEEQPELTNEKVVAHLKAEARPVTGGDDFLGFGILTS